MKFKTRIFTAMIAISIFVLAFVLSACTSSANNTQTEDAEKQASASDVSGTEGTEDAAAEMPEVEVQSEPAEEVPDKQVDTSEWLPKESAASGSTIVVRQNGQ